MDFQIVHGVVNTMQPTPQRQDNHQKDECAADKALGKGQHTLIAEGVGRSEPQRQQDADQQHHHRRDDRAPHAACAKQPPEYGFIGTFRIGINHLSQEKSRAKERIFSFRNSAQAWDPKNQRPEMWKLYNTKIQKGESMRVFPISNWTEKDIWQYIQRENIEIVPLYFAKERPVIYRDGNIIMVDDDRLKLRPGEKIENKKVRFRTLGCYPLTGGIESEADTLDEIIDETLSAVSSERTSRVIDHEAAGSMERRKREGYF